MENVRTRNERKHVSPRFMKVDEIFDALDSYCDFCKSYGYNYKEQDLFNMKVYSFQQYVKYSNGKKFKDQLGYDLKRYGYVPSKTASK